MFERRRLYNNRTRKTDSSNYFRRHVENEVPLWEIGRTSNSLNTASGWGFIRGGGGRGERE